MEKHLELFKKCSKCGKLKSLSDFYYKNKKHTKLNSICKICVIHNVVNWQKRNWEKHKTYKQIFYWHNHQKETNRKSQNQINAYYAVEKATRLGKLIKSKNCQLCGQRGKLEAHHFNGYNPKDWLKIIWLCTKCHGKEHSKYKIA